MKLLIMQAIANGYEVLYFDKEEKKWFEFTNMITDQDIEDNRFTLYIRSVLR